jgi:hypothetical protein
MTSPTRPIVVSHIPSGARISFPVLASETLLTQAEIARDEFVRWLDQQADSPLLQLNHSQVTEKSEDEEDHAEDLDAAQADHQRALEASLILLAHYLHFLSTRPTDHHDLILLVLNHFHAEVLKNNLIDLHSAAFHQTSSEEARRLVIKAYYLARHSISHPLSDLPSLPVGRLWKHDEPQKKLVGVFGGQGVNETYWQELVVSS